MDSGCRLRIKLSRRRALRLAAAGPLVLTRGLLAAGRSIDESGFVPVGGIEQWIAIQGQDVANPAVVYLHGGPAEAQSPFLKQFVPWERDFTIINWDQRGSGKTYGRNGPATPGMSTPDQAVATLAQDTRELAQYVCQRLSTRKVTLLGQSWGAVLGLHAVRQWPHLFQAFVGTGQPVSWPLSLENAERWARQQATASGDSATLQALDASQGLPSSDMRRIRAPNKYRMSASDLEYLKIQREFAGAPPFPDHGDVADWIAGFDFTGSKLGSEMWSFDVRQDGLEFRVPIYVIQGRDDHVVSFDAAKQFVAQVRAPRKAFTAIEGGHFACFTNSAEFLTALHRDLLA
jgi:pimeloyl-ACP methyl ester carboxylesterase